MQKRRPSFAANNMAQSKMLSWKLSQVCWSESGQSLGNYTENRTWQTLNRSRNRLLKAPLMHCLQPQIHDEVIFRRYITYICAPLSKKTQSPYFLPQQTMELRNLRNPCDAAILNFSGNPLYIMSQRTLRAVSRKTFCFDPCDSDVWLESIWQGSSISGKR